MDLPQLFAEGEEILNGKRLGRILNGLDKGQRRKTRLFNVRKIDGGGRPAEIRDPGRERADQCGMSFRRWSLLEFVQRDMDVLQPFVRFLDKEIDEFFLEFIRCIARHAFTPLPRHAIEQPQRWAVAWGVQGRISDV